MYSCNRTPGARKGIHAAGAAAALSLLLLLSVVLLSPAACAASNANVSALPGGGGVVPNASLTSITPVVPFTTGGTGAGVNSATPAPTTAVATTVATTTAVPTATSVSTATATTTTTAATTVPVTAAQATTSATVAAANTTAATTAATTPVPTTTAALPAVPPKVEFSGSPLDGTVPLTVTFTPYVDATGGLPASLTWDFGDSIVVTEPLQARTNHTYQMAGNYTVTLTSANSAGRSVTTKQQYVTVRAPVAANVTPVPTTTQAGPCQYANQTAVNFTADQVTGPAPLTVKFTDTSTCAQPLAWMWDFGVAADQDTKLMKNPQVLYSQPGNYTVTLVVVNGFQRSANLTRTAYIQVLPPIGAPGSVKPTTIPTPVPVTQVPMILPVDFSSNITNGTAPLCVRFASLATAAGADGWSWDFGDNTTSAERDPLHCYQKEGNYTVVHRAMKGSLAGAKVRERYIAVAPGIVKNTTGTAGPVPDLLVPAIAVIALIAVAGGFIYLRTRGKGGRRISGGRKGSL